MEDWWLLQELQTPQAGGSRAAGLCTGDGAREGPRRCEKQQMGAGVT